MRKIIGLYGRAKNRIYAKYVIPKVEREETFADGKEKMHYLFYPKKSDYLIVGFQAYNSEGPRYNYVGSLSGVPASRLYIKDDFIDPTGNFYLGRNRSFYMEDAVIDLIKRKKEECGAKKLIFIGSCKGALAAVSIGLTFADSVIIAGAPKYYLGSYMKDATKFHPVLVDLYGENYTEKDLKELDERIPARIRDPKTPRGQKIYLHCSVNESTYPLHVSYMLKDLRESGREVIFDEAHYGRHDELRYYFPAFLKASLDRELRR